MCKTSSRATQTASPAEKDVINIAKASPGPPLPPGLFPTAQTFTSGNIPAAMQVAFDIVKAQTKFKNLAFAIIDLTSAPPVYIGHNDKKHALIASTGKISILFAAFWLRKTVRENAKGVNAADTNALFDTLKAIWSAVPQPYPGKFANHMWPPDLHHIFTAVKTGPGLWDIDFISDKNYAGAARQASLDALGPQHNKPMNIINALGFRDRMELMIGWSDNNASGSLINAMGFQFVNGCLLHGGFFKNDPGGGGLWLSGNYAGKSFASEFTTINPQKITTQGGTPDAIARFMYQLATKKLVDANAANEMFTMMEFNGSWVEEELTAKGHLVGSWLAKVGVANGKWTEATYLEEDKNGTTLKYVLAPCFAGSEASLKELAVALAGVVAAAHP
jgi:hypothetical protein